MGNDTTPSSAGETPTGTSPQGETPNTQTGETPGSTTQETTQQELERLKASLKRANAEAKTHREKAEELDRLKAESEASKLTETERLQKQLAEREAVHDGLIESIVDYEVRLKAAELGVPAQNLKHVAKLIWDDLEFDQSTGMPTNVEPLLKDLLKELDLTGKRGASAGGATNPGRQAANNAGLSWGVITKMTPEQYAARQAEIQAWMRRSPPKGF